MPLYVNVWRSRAANGAPGLSYDLSHHSTLEDAIEDRDTPSEHWEYRHSYQIDPTCRGAATDCDLDACLREQWESERLEAQYERGLRAMGAR